MVIAAAVMILALLAAGWLLIALRRARAAESRYLSLIENLPQDSLILFDRDLRFNVVVGAAVRESPLEAAEIEGRRLHEVIPGKQGEILARHYRAALRGESRSLEYASVIDGRDSWLRVVPVRERGEIVGGMAISQDITDRKRAERERELAEVGRQLMIDAMSEAYVALDSEGRITDWNEGATRMFGFSRAEVLGRPAKEVYVPEQNHAQFDWLIERYTRGERAGQRLDLRVDRAARHKDGHLFTVELAAATLNHEGEVSIHTFMHDITARKDAEVEAEAHAADLAALADATAALSRSTVPEEARLAICRAATRIAGADVAIMFEPEPGGTGLRSTAAEGVESTWESLPFVGHTSGAVRAFTSREPLFISDLEGDGIASRSLGRTGVVSALWVPIVRGDSALGVIAVGFASLVEELPERVMRAMTPLAAEAAVAIERAQLLNRLARMARTDDLTGLPNRRAWHLELARELARSRREGMPLTIAMVDLDHFKAYNDRHGHQAGDRLLKQAAAAWREALRESDLLARYGGEEFTVALPGCSLEEAEDLIERLRSVTPEGESCSAGLAQWDRSERAEELIDRADQALYLAKQRGRDRTVVS